MQPSLLLSRSGLVAPRQSSFCSQSCVRCDGARFDQQQLVRSAVRDGPTGQAGNASPSTIPRECIIAHTHRRISDGEWVVMRCEVWYCDLALPLLTRTAAPLVLRSMSGPPLVLVAPLLLRPVSAAVAPLLMCPVSAVAPLLMCPVSPLVLCPVPAAPGGSQRQRLRRTPHAERQRRLSYSSSGGDSTWIGSSASCRNGPDSPWLCQRQSRRRRLSNR